jgi:uncharacterized protein YbaR (Trm112 family)
MERKFAMKKCFTLVVVIAVGMALCLTANAYYPHLTVRACPHCKAHVVQEDTLSGNTIGAVFYTDGKREARMLPDHPLLAKCPACKGLFWVDEAREVAAGFEAAKGKQKVLNPSEGELLAFLSGATLAKDKELYLRQRAWWVANDARRHARGAKTNFSDAQVKNLQAFSAMLDETREIERIFKAEIARELGQFDTCRQLLSPLFGENLQKVADFIRKRADEGDRDVSPITF